MTSVPANALLPRKKLPIGLQTLAGLLDDGCYYADKSGYAVDLAQAMLMQARPNTTWWQRMLPLLKQHKVTFHWLKGHAGHPENERCDILARAQACRRDLPQDTGYKP